MGGNGCLTDETLTSFVEGRLADAERATAERHVAGCAECGAVVATLARALYEDDDASSDREAPPTTPGGTRGRPPLLAPGQRVSRYEIVEPIGAGGGGVVYRAFDPRLKRRVALKLLSFPAEEAPSEAATLRLLGEAETMAQLSHPNVVPIHDAGTSRGRVFIIMELVEGEPASAWLRKQPRAWRETLEVFRAAAEGLAAAHALGVVHGDFKPANVIVGADGRPRVADFGLARIQAAAKVEPPSGIVGGTPAYMAPEQWEGRAPDARADQFSFCVSLYEALYGEHPFVRGPVPRTRKELREVLGAFQPPAAAPRPEPPSRLFPILLRGLHRDPSQRFPSMPELLSAIQAALAARRRRWWRPTALALAGSAAIALFLGRPTRHRAAPALPCDGASVGAAAAAAWEGNCYLRFDDPRAWSEARAACERNDAALVSYRSAIELRWVQSEVGGTAPELWTALHFEKGSGLAWATGEPLEGNLQRWLRESSIEATDGDCFAQTSARLGSYHPLRKLPCFDRLPFVCRREGWTRRAASGHWYRISPDVRDFQVAKARCEQWGGHLATVTDAEENSFVATLVHRSSWLGAVETADRKSFRWMTDERFSFRALAPGEPDQQGIYPAGIVMGTDGRWYDRPTTQGHPYVCESD